MKAQRQRKVSLILLGFMVFLSLGTLLKHWPFYMRFWISKSALDSFAEKEIATPFPIEKKRVGLFNIEVSTKKKGWIAIVFNGNAVLLKNGLLVYVRNTQEWEKSLLRPLAGYWYWTAVDDAELEAILSGR